MEKHRLDEIERISARLAGARLNLQRLEAEVGIAKNLIENLERDLKNAAEGGQLVTSRVAPGESDDIPDFDTRYQVQP